ncbi:MAG: hypothetical protein GQ574_17910 [Crocinitomix sp.]|nr:hypothetical protein [Crocinitomix sp.]
MNIKLHITVLMTLLMGSIFSQEETIPNKHSIGLGISYYTFYNGTPIIQTDTLFTPHSASRSLGLNYQYKVNEKVSWLASIDMYTFRDFSSLAEIQAGDIRHQNFMLFQWQYQYTVWQSKRSELKGAIGLSFRGGSAVVHVYYNNSGNGGTSLVLGKGYLDVGIPLGLNYTYYIGKHFHLNTRLTHTFFPYTYEKKTNYTWDKSPYWNMTSLSLGFGFNFGM